MASDAQREAAKDAVVEAARSVVKAIGIGPANLIIEITAMDIMLDRLDALQAEPPHDAESELPPRGVAWREMMARVDHEDGC